MELTASQKCSLTIMAWFTDTRNFEGLLANAQPAVETRGAKRRRVDHIEAQHHKRQKIDAEQRRNHRRFQRRSADLAKNLDRPLLKTELQMLREQYDEADDLKGSDVNALALFRRAHHEIHRGPWMRSLRSTDQGCVVTALQQNARRLIPSHVAHFEPFDQWVPALELFKWLRAQQWDADAFVRLFAELDDAVRYVGRRRAAVAAQPTDAPLVPLPVAAVQRVERHRAWKVLVLGGTVPVQPVVVAAATAAVPPVQRSLFASRLFEPHVLRIVDQFLVE